MEHKKDVIARMWKKIVLNRKVKNQVHIRPRLRPKQTRGRVQTNMSLNEVKETFSQQIRNIKDSNRESNRESYRDRRFLILPYKVSRSSGRKYYNESKIVSWIERGIHPLTGENFGPAGSRSVFDYLTDEQLDLAIELSKRT